MRLGYHGEVCGRYVLADPESVFADLFGLVPPSSVGPRYNIAPSQAVPAVRLDRTAGEPRAALLRWGLIPHWADDPEIGNRLINARSETADRKPSFRDAFRRRRCVLPADGFFEWRTMNGAKQPWLVRMKNGSGFALGGLWDAWSGPGGEVVESCTILTTEPNDVVAPLHGRMPVIVPRERFDVWLGGEGEKVPPLRTVLAPYPADEMEAYPVSRRVNTPANDDPGCIEHVSG